MADVVDYSSINVNFNELMVKLHQVAIENAASNDVLIRNTAISEEEGGSGRFGGAGEYFIFVTKKDGSDVDDSERSDFLHTIQTYVKYFVGEDASKLIKKNDLCPMVTLAGDEAPNSGGENPAEGGQQPNTQGGQAGNQANQGAQNVAEGLFVSFRDRKLMESINLLFEDDPQPGTDTSSSSTSAAGNNTENADKKDDEGSNKGFCIAYAIDVAGEQRRGLADTFRRKGKGFLGGMWADLANMQIKTLGGGSIKIGRLFDRGMWKDKFGTPDINIETVDNNIQGIIHNDFPQSSAQVRVYDTTTLINLIRNQRRSSPEIEGKLKKANYAVTILVEKRDGAYREYTKDKVADICTRAFGTATNMMNFNKVKADDIIRIDGWNSEQKVQSVYDVKRNNSTNSMSANSASAKESQVFILRGNLVESILHELFEDDETELVLEDILLEGHAHEYNECVAELKKIGIENLKAGLEQFKKDYEAAANKCRQTKEVKGKKGEKNTQIVGVKLPPDLAKHKEHADAYMELLKKGYMRGGSANPFINRVVSEWQKCDTIDAAISAFNKYITERGKVDYSNERTVECWMALQALKKMKHMPEQKKITISFKIVDPQSNEEVEYDKKIENVMPGQVPQDQIPNSDEMENYLRNVGTEGDWKFTGWTPDPNTLTEDGTVVGRYTKPEESGDTGKNEISATFTKKDPSNPGSESETLKTLVAEPHKFDVNQYPTQDEVKYENWNFKGWDPDPNTLSDSGTISAQYVREEGSGETSSIRDISVYFRSNDPTRSNSLEKTVYSMTIGKEDLGNIDTKEAEGKLSSFEGYHFKEWNPDPNDYDEHNLSSKTITTRAVWAVGSKDTISVRFVYKNPEKENALPTLLSTYVTDRKNFGRIPDDAIADMLPKFDKFEFDSWNPDPNEYNDESFPDKGVASVEAKFKKPDGGANQWDIFIIPHKRLTSQNRPNKEEKFDDGTVRAKASDAEYKPSDTRM